jgi:hypothetical protein
VHDLAKTDWRKIMGALLGDVRGRDGEVEAVARLGRDVDVQFPGVPAGREPHVGRRPVVRSGVVIGTISTVARPIDEGRDSVRAPREHEVVVPGALEDEGIHHLRVRPPCGHHDNGTVARPARCYVATDDP